MYLTVLPTWTQVGMLIAQQDTGGYVVMKINGSDSDPLALFDITQPVNMESGKVSGWEGSWQHFFSGTPSV